MAGTALGDLFRVVLPAASAVLSLALLGPVVMHFRRRGPEPMLLAFGGVLVGSMIWSLADVFAILTLGTVDPLVWRQLEQIGVVLVPASLLLLALSFAGFDRWITRRTLGVLAVEPVVTLLLSATNEIHHLMWRSVEVVSNPGTGEPIEVTFGPYFYVHSVWSYALVVVAIVIFLRRAVRGSDLYRSQTIALVFGATVPLFVSVVNTFELVSDPVPAPVGFAVAAVALGYAVFRHRLLDVVPVARDTVIENMRDGVVVVDADDRIVDANPAARELAGGDPVGDRFETAFPNCSDLLVDEGADLLELDPAGSAETRFVRAGVSPLGAANRLGRVVTFRDVTERERRERDLERANERLEEFASVVAHDLRNPLNVADGYLGIIGEENESEHVRKVADAHDRMETILDSLLQLAKHGQTVDELEPVELDEVVENAWDSVETGDLQLDVTTDAAVRADENRLQQLFENLFRNVREHAEGAARVTVGPLDDDQGFYVEDDGPGLPEETDGEVFDHGVTTNDDGTGLGLAIVRTIAEAHGWTVSITESDSGGARFDFRDVTPVTRR